MSAAERLTIRGDGVEVGTIRLGSQAMMWDDETWSPSEAKQIARRSHRGTYWTDTVTLRQRLDELAGEYGDTEHGESLWRAVRGCRVVTIRYEYVY